ncbi:MAG: hypothetical protein CMH83_05895 [Nocardioides sp.]|nr:hypothetical protein [Nocardioides sp.]
MLPTARLRATTRQAASAEVPGQHDRGTMRIQRRQTLKRNGSAGRGRTEPRTGTGRRLATGLLAAFGTACASLGIATVTASTATAGTIHCRAYESISCISSTADGGLDTGYRGVVESTYLVDDYGNNCTNYAAYRLRRNGVPGSMWQGLGNADRWDDVARDRGVPVDGEPAVGAIAQWDSQHVSYVEEVASDGSWIKVSESSYGPITIDGSTYRSSSGYKTITQGTDWPDNFIHFADQTDEEPARPVTSAGGTIATGVTSGGTLYMATVNARGHMVRRYLANGKGTWSTWATIGKGFAKGTHISMPTLASGRLYLMAIDATGQMKRRYVKSNGAWSTWAIVGRNFRVGTEINTPALASQNLYSVTVTKAGKLVRRYQTNSRGDWSTWATIGGGF